MNGALFAKLLSDSHAMDLKKLHYRFPQVDMVEFISQMKTMAYTMISLPDREGQNLVFLANVLLRQRQDMKPLLSFQDRGVFDSEAAESEIISTMDIEGIKTSRDSVRRILGGDSPSNEEEHQIYDMKRGLDFISDPANTITEENIHKLYQMAIGSYLEPDERLLPGRFYRHDAVYVVGQKVEHTGLPHEKLSAYMGRLVEFIQNEQNMDNLLKAAVIHFYVAYCHPYFDGNGRMARFLHLWYLFQYGPLPVCSMSAKIREYKEGYYTSFSLVERNARISSVVDVTPFLSYFVKLVYD